MKRRAFVALGATSLVFPTAVFAAPKAYTPGLVQKRLAKGDTVFLDFKASWCSTCRAQERVIKAIKGANPDYENKITFIDVDWDDFGGGDLVKTLNIPRRSTLVVLKGDKELGRIVAQTGQAEIKALMDVALKAANVT